MPRANLARVLAPTLLESVALTDMESAHRDNKRSIKVLECLLALPANYWGNMLGTGYDCPSPTNYTSDEQPHTPGTPEMLKGSSHHNIVIIFTEQ